MACYIKQINHSAGLHAAARNISVSGVVNDSSAQPISRVVVIFGANNLLNPIGIMSSSLEDGSFSFIVPGVSGSTEFVCIVQGEVGENCVAHSHKTGI